MLLTLRVCSAGLLAMYLSYSGVAHAESTDQQVPGAMALLSEAIAAQTVAGKGNVPAFAKLLAAKLESAGFTKADIEIIPVGETAALAVRYRGTGEGKPILLSAHMDVVPADAADWDHKPFELKKSNGYLYGRGVADMKTNLVAMVETFIRLKRENFVPRHDMVLVFSGDEETDANSSAELAKRYKDAEFLLNGDGVGNEAIYTQDLKPILFKVQASEKTYADFKLEATSPGGHSSEPDVPGNAIYRLAKALGNIQAFQFPVQYDEITRASLSIVGKLGQGPAAEAMTKFSADPKDANAAAMISSSPSYIGQIRTTCIATMVNGGHAENALPQRATATVNCRIFPGNTVAEVKKTLIGVVADPSVKVTTEVADDAHSPASPLRPDVMQAITATVHERFPGLEIVPTMSSYATDSQTFRLAGVPSYGINPIFAKPGDTFAHGLNERILEGELPAALSFWHSLLSRLAK